MPRQGSNITTQAVGPTGGTYLYMVPEYSLHFEEASWQTDVVSWRDRSGAFHRIFAMDGKETTKTPPHALAHLSEKYSFLHGLVNCDPPQAPLHPMLSRFTKHGLILPANIATSDSSLMFIVTSDLVFSFLLFVDRMLIANVYSALCRN